MKKTNKKRKGPKCSICYKKSSNKHCTTCKGEDKNVCRSCIIQMLELKNCVCACLVYSCPHCRTLISANQNWMENNCDVLKKHNELLYERLRSAEHELYE